MYKDIVLEVKSVSKIFKKKRGIEILALLFGLRGKQASNLGGVQALQDISFTLRKGDAFGIIGRNGSGKSTLLQIIAGTMSASTGSSFINGRVSALLELGSGFNPEFTGKENIYLTGAIYGITKIEMDRRVDEIIAFADIGDFINSPVKTYSSGMLMRVAFAVAISIEPDVLIIDEALSVGDILFQQKCNKRLKELMGKGVSMLVVTHDTSFVLNLCQNALWLDKGCNKFIGLASDCVKHYLAEMAMIAGNNTSQKIKFDRSNRVYNLPSLNPIDINFNTRIGSNMIEINRVWLLNENSKPATVFRLDDWITVIIEIKANAHVENASAGAEIRDRHGQVLFANGLRVINKLIASIDKNTTRAVKIKFQANLCPGKYTLDVGCGAGISEGAIGQRVLSVAVIDILTDSNQEIVHGLVKLPSVVEIL